MVDKELNITKDKVTFITVIVIVSLIICSLTATNLWVIYRGFIDDAKQNIETLNISVSQYVTQTFDNARLTFQYVSSQAKLDDSKCCENIKPILGLTLPLSIYDNKGQRIYTLNKPLLPNKLDNTIINENFDSFYEFYNDPRRDTTYMVRSITTIKGTYYFVVEVPLDHIKDLFKRLSHQGYVVDLFGSKSEILIRIPDVLPLDKIGTTDPRIRDISKNITEKKEDHTFTHSGIYDSFYRITNMRKIKDYPFYTVVSLSFEQILTTWIFYFANCFLALVIITMLLTWKFKYFFKIFQDFEIKIKDLTEVANHWKQCYSKEHLEKKHKIDFFANTSHEFKTPLNSIIGFSEILQGLETCDLNKVKKYAEYINGSGQHLLNVIMDFLDITRIESGNEVLELTEIQPKHILDSCMIFLEEKASNYNITIKTSLESVTFWGDIRLMKHILINLISNAIKYNKIHGSVEIKFSEEVDYMVWTVSDTGIGIEKERLSTIFDPYTTSSIDGTGTGLGLSIVKSYVELQGGKIEVNSVMGVGTEFKVYLPKNITVNK